ncbi:MAG: hypothetical protein HS115_12255 [Spirochaetales bacterium]|nr:hypothetical protein [Spirochaetales bacterium]
MNSIQRIIGAFGGMPALRQHGSITVQKGNRRLDITLIKYGLQYGEAICVEQSTEDLTDREMHFAVSAEIWLPYYLRIPAQVEVIAHSIQTDAFVSACLQEHATVWDMALFREGFDRLTHEQFPLFAGMA